MEHHHFCNDLEKEWSKCCTLILMGVDATEAEEYYSNDDYGHVDYGLYEEEDEEEEKKENKDYNESTVPVINLLPSSRSAKAENEIVSSASTKDPWLQGARTLAESIHQMASLLQRKSTAYLSSSSSPSILNTSATATWMKDSERAMLENTVASFSAATANQIESLRQAAQQLLLMDENNNTHSNNKDLAGHRAGIIASLILNLRVDVADPMSRMQKIRKERIKYIHVEGTGAEDCDKASLLQCRLVPSSLPSSTSVQNDYNNNDILQNDNYDDDDDDEIQQEEDMFTSVYFNNDDDEEEITKALQMNIPPTPTLTSNRIEEKEQEEEVAVSLAGFIKPSPTKKGQIPMTPKPAKMATNSINAPKIPYNQFNYDDEQYHQQQQQEDQHHKEELQRESAYLTAKLSTTKLNDVQKVEETMMEITSLLSQFSVMIGDQQEDIMMIHDSATRSKKNVRKGEEELHGAGKRRERSKHYMALFIFGLGVILLFLHFISP